QTPPEQTPPEQTPPEQTTPEQTPPEQTPPEQTPPEQTPPEQTTPEQTPPEQTPPEQTPPEQTPPEQTTTSYWESEGITAGRFRAWSAGEFGPEKAVGVSGMAFGDSGTLYMACEKFPALVSLSDNGQYQVVKLDGFNKNDAGENDFDVEAITIDNDMMYLADEDHPLIYSVAVSRLKPDTVVTVTSLPVIDGPQKIVRDATFNDDTSDNSSIEGLVVSAQNYFPNDESQSNAGPFFYMLDERDIDDNQTVARVYKGIQQEQQIHIISEPVSFTLDTIPKDFLVAQRDNLYRLSELFEYQGNLYALKTRKGIQPQTKPDYKVVRLNFDGKSLENVCDLTAAALQNSEQYDTNFEGAAVGPEERLFVTADNENYHRNELRSLQVPPDVQKAKGRKKTPLLEFKLKQTSSK
ncbi:MAG: esterase-like activity of phytase family protein, partial [Planctomycetaceae bacterium]